MESTLETVDARGLEAAHAWSELSRRIRLFLGELTLADFASTKSTSVWKQREDSVSNLHRHHVSATHGPQQYVCLTTSQRKRPVPNPTKPLEQH